MRPVFKALIAFGALAALVAVFFLSQSLKNNDQPTPTPDTRAELIANTEIVSLQIQNANGDFSFEKKDGEWLMTGHEGLALVKNVVSGIALTLEGIKGVETIVHDGGASPEEFGFNAPEAVVTVTHVDGLREVLLLGLKNISTGEYYAMREGAADIVTIDGSTAGRLLYGISDFRDKTLPSVNQEIIQTILLKSEREEILISGEETQSEELESYGITYLSMLSPYPGRDVATTKLSDLFTSLSGLSIGGFVEDNAADLSKYGLDEPSFELRLEDGEGVVLHLLFGDDDGEDVYFMEYGESNVYTMKKSRIEPAMTVTGFELADHFIIIYNIELVDSVVLQDGDELLELTIKRTPQEGEEKPLETFFANGVECEDKPFRAVYTGIISILADAPLKEEFTPAAGPEVTATFNFNNGNPPAVMKLYKYDENFFAAGKNDSIEFLTSRRYLENVRQKVDALLNP